MPVTLTEEQNALATAIGEFARREIPDKAARDRLTADGPHSDEIYRKMAELGWLGIALPEAYGGADGSMTDLLVFLEETAYQQAPIGGFGTTIITAEAIKKFGSEAQKQELLAGVCRGDVLAISMSEPGAGSDVGGLTCKATKTEDGWVINGQKTWCSNAHIASHILLVARTSTEGGKHDGLTMFVVPTDVAGPGDPRHRDHGRQGGQRPLLHRTATCRPTRWSATEGQGWRQLMAGLNLERMILAGLMLGLGRRAFDDTARLRQGAQAVRPARRQLPGACGTGSPTTPPSSPRPEAARARHRAHVIDAEPGSPVPEARRRWPSSRPPSWPSTCPSRGCRCSAATATPPSTGWSACCARAVVSTVYGGTSEIQRDIIGKTLGL